MSGEHRNTREAPTTEPKVCGGVIPDDGRVYRHFVLLTGGEDKAIDALNIAYTVLSEIDEGDAIEAAVRYLISRFAVQMRSQIRQGGRYGCTHCD